jgi:protein-disulfide isomerase
VKFISLAFSRAAMIGAALIAFGAAGAAEAPKPERTVDMATVLKPGPLPELTIGDASGVPIVEYGSLTCPHCAAFAHGVLPKLKAAYLDTGKARFIFREFSRNPLDVAAFVLARCVGDDKALATIDLLFASQDKWAFVESPLEPLLAAVRPTGLGRDKATECLKDKKLADEVTQIGKTASDVVKLQGTPTFVIDGKVYGGELSMDEFDAILKPLIK